MGVGLVDGSELGYRKMMNKLEIWLAGWGAGGLQEKYVIVLFSKVSVHFFPPLSPYSMWKKRFHSLLRGWRSCFVLTFAIGSLVGWECAAWNPLGSHLAPFMKLLCFMWKGEKDTFLSVRAPARVRELCQCRLPFSLGNCAREFLPRPCDQNGKVNLEIFTSPPGCTHT